MYDKLRILSSQMFFSLTGGKYIQVSAMAALVELSESGPKYYQSERPWMTYR